MATSSARRRRRRHAGGIGLSRRALRRKTGCRDRGGVCGLGPLPVEREHVRLASPGAARRSGAAPAGACTRRQPHRPGVGHPGAGAGHRRRLVGIWRSRRSTRACSSTRERIAVVPARFGWSDVGDWNNLGELIERDDFGNSVRGDVVQSQTRNSVVWSETGRLVALVGLENIAVVDTDGCLARRQPRRRARGPPDRRAAQDDAPARVLNAPRPSGGRG